jgi:SWI/SNF-related matrix-associated actin-dependent regulator 1 of chromatin subfamily A
MACDYVLARKILVVTTSSGRPNFAREFREWQRLDRSVQVIYAKNERIPDNAQVVIVGWSAISDPALHVRLMQHEWDVLILDESHFAKSPEAKRTRAAYDLTEQVRGHVWCLTGTPCANAPNDLWPMLNALAPGLIDDMSYDAFLRRYCVVVPRNINGRTIDVVKGGRNTGELAQRIDSFVMRRTQKDVGIRPPIFSVFSVAAPEGRGALWPADDRNTQAILKAAENGDTATLEMHLGTIRRLTGTIKAKAVADAVKEEFDAGLDKIVLMAWHKDTMKVLRDELSLCGVVGIDGGTHPTERARAVHEFQRGKARVFVGQIQAAGEAIDLSAASELMFVEPSFVPKDMAQAAMRITNHGQKRQAHVRVAALAGSIDEAVMAVLARKVSTIKELMSNAS